MKVPVRSVKPPRLVKPCVNFVAGSINTWIPEVRHKCQNIPLPLKELTSKSSCNIQEWKLPKPSPQSPKLVEKLCSTKFAVFTFCCNFKVWSSSLPSFQILIKAWRSRIWQNRLHANWYSMDVYPFCYDLKTLHITLQYSFSFSAQRRAVFFSQKFVKTPSFMLCLKCLDEQVIPSYFELRIPAHRRKFKIHLILSQKCISKRTINDAKEDLEKAKVLVLVNLDHLKNF